MNLHTDVPPTRPPTRPARTVRAWATGVALAGGLLAASVGCATDPFRDTPPARPVALAPETGSELLINARTRFSWQGSALADRYEFHIFDQSNGDISRYYLRDLRAGDICSPSDGSTGRTCSVELAVALPYLKGHAWRVRAGNVAGWSSWTRNTFGMVSAGLVPGVPARAEVPLGN